MENDLFAENRVSKAYLRISLPLVLSMVVMMIYNLADTFFVAQTNNTALVAGVSLAAPVFSFMMAFGNILGQGGSSLISRFLGKGQHEDVRRVSAFCFYFTLALSLLIGAAMLLFRVPLLYMLGADRETFRYVSEYYFFLAVGAPFILLSFIHSNLLRCEGLSKASMIGTVGGVFINILLDPLLISVLHLGAAGAAIATVVSYLFADLFHLIIVLKRSKNLSVHPGRALAAARYFWQIVTVGLPSAVSNLMQGAAVVLMNNFLLPYGNDKIAAMGIGWRISMIAYLILTGFTIGGQPLFGYYYGAGMKDRLRRLLRFTLKFITLIAAGMTVILCALAPQILGLFMDDTGIVAEGARMLRWQGVSLVFVGFVLLITIVFQSLGKPLGSLLLSIGRQGLLFLAALLLASRFLGYTGIIASQAMADLLTACLALVLFRLQLRKEFLEAPPAG